ncbi:beta-galactosidase [Haloactinopolyspora alba]|uniref:Beta-galactosidase n=1 Tax=Haloactinopolyspora alba TaxID=648780 RepID=A0A2P8E053_9ACTN|nr:glycoside hydrolase family 2 TIM barrel-domain containing protein [Haloactinopolyspora alba]PSL02851.1 beta-galactosidase [Haloactinopolyspora alba]
MHPESGAHDGISRRRLLKTGMAGMVGAGGLAVLGHGGIGAAGAAATTRTADTTRGPAARTLPLNEDWLFAPMSLGDQGDQSFTLVTLPHTVTELSWRQWDPTTWQRTWSYRKHFDVDPQLNGLRLFADFDGALTGATVSINGEPVGEHLGGYLPFGVELTDHVRDRDNVLAVELDSRFNLDVPPNVPDGSPTAVDFWQPGGLYRSVSLRAVPHTFLADVFAKPVDVLSDTPRVDVECTVDAASVPDRPVRVEIALLDGDRQVATTSVDADISEAGSNVVRASLTGLGDVRLWDVDDPYLYTVVATLVVDERAVHDHTRRIGLRQAEFTGQGFLLNGRRHQLFGLNRHQFYPFAGGSMPDRVQRKDAEMLRNELNCTIVRCSHYPQAEAFLDACDELGLLVFDEVPGWQYLGDESWRELAYRDVHDMVVRDRNHPSVIIWGARLNETRDHADFYGSTRDLAHSLDDSRPTTGSMIAFRHGSTEFVQDVFSYNDYRRHDGHASLQPPRTDRPYLVTEAVGTLSGGARFYRRTDPVAVQQDQAVSHAYVHDIAASDERYCGLIAWCGFDYPSGTGNQHQGIKTPGVVDLFRFPKPGAAFYRSQVDPQVRPVIVPAFTWDFGPQSPPDGPGADAVVCSNCDRLELFVGGEHHATAQPDRERFPHLAHPPFLVDLTVDGSALPELRIDGYVGDELVLSRSFSADPSGDALTVRADDAELDADGTDATRISFEVLDRHGATRPYVQGEVGIEVDGPADLVGESPFAFGDSGGVGAVWVRSRRNTPGPVTVTVTHPELGSDQVTIHTRNVPPGGPPPPAVSVGTHAERALIVPGRTTTVTARVTNKEQPALRDVDVSVAVPHGWTARPATPTTIAALQPGQSATVRWEVDVPADAAPGNAVVDTRATFTLRTSRTSVSSAASVVIASTVAAARNNTGTSSDDDVDQGNLDGVGNSYSRQALAAEGLDAGATVRHDGLDFSWPDVPPGQPDNIVATGQTVFVDGAGERLGVLGASSSGSVSGPGVVHYTDGSTATFTLTLDDWWYEPGPANEIVAATPYVNSQGLGGRPRGQRDHTVRIFAASAPLDPAKTVEAVTLPAGGSTGPGRVTGMHLFALAVG